MRYLPLTDTDRQAMLATIGAASIDDLFVDVPAEARLSGQIEGLPDHASELAVERHMSKLARQNLSAGEAPFFLGAGAYKHHVPASVDHLIQRGEFLTAYTPYQPEIAQGTLQVLFEFQTQVARLLGCDVANASMYDGSTACWEAIGMARRITKRGKAILSSGLHPHYVSVARTMAKFTGDVLAHEAPTLTAQTDIDALIAAIDKDVSCVVVQYPDILGRIADLTPLADAAHAAGALLVAVVTEPVALGALVPPGEMGADIVVGEGQSIGVGLQFGGPYLGLFACKQKYVRQMPGRLCGETVDAAGKRGFVLTLSTREQHIRREKATSNICTNSGLCALAFSIHMTLLGERGLRDMASLNHGLAVQAADRLAQVPGVTLLNDSFFNEFTLVLTRDARDVVRS
ncbi:MAG: aminomethyl-transferring glycine dehydrogenase subunit GcvPA, partial [Alphaproteobacteria bacterium]